jgi:hypothetical protein
MHRTIFCLICLLALVGVFGPGDLTSNARVTTVSASAGATQPASAAATPGQPLALAPQRDLGDATWTVRQAPPQAQHLLGRTLARGAADLRLSGEETRRSFGVPGTYILRAEGSAGAEEFVVVVAE